MYEEESELPIITLSHKDFKPIPKQEPIQKIRIIATAYTNSYEDCGKTDGITASGVRVSRGMVAAPKSIPFGTKIKIDNYGIVEVQDRGGAIIEEDDGSIHLDIFFNTKEEVVQFGRKIMYGTILK